MFTRDADGKTENIILIHWLLMSVCSGVMNSVAFIGLGMFATHVTGFATLIGVGLAHLEWRNALTAMSVPLFFLLGSIISGSCIEVRLRNQQKPHYDYVMYLCSLLLLIAVIFSERKGFEVDLVNFQLKNSFLLLSLICMASGLLNAALSHSSHSTVRITHLTGITTDLGRGISEMISSGFKFFPDQQRVVRINRLRALTVISFIMGSLLGAVSFATFSFRTLLVPALYFVYAGFHGRDIKVSIKI